MKLDKNKKRRIRSPHPRVKLKKRTLPSGAVSHFARVYDPDTKKEKDVTLDPVAMPTAEARKLWAVRRSKTIAKRLMELDGGAPASEAAPLSELYKDYTENTVLRLRPKTLRKYGEAERTFLAWCKAQGIESSAQLTPGKLASFHTHLLSRPLLAPKPGGKAGERRPTGRRRQPRTFNGALRPIKTMLGTWRAGGKLPHITGDTIRDTLKALRVADERPEYLTPTQLVALIDAARRHDIALFAETRDEHAGIRIKGSTVRYRPILFFTVFLLLSGCRLAEALRLKWTDVDLDAADQYGKRAGEIRLFARDTKTLQGRTVGLEVSPALRAMLARMKLRARDKEGLVFGYTEDFVTGTRGRMRTEFEAPRFTWQLLRSTCSTYLTNAPGIYGSAAHKMAAIQLGHSVTVAEDYYAGVIRGIPRSARTLEAAMQIEDALRDAFKPSQTQSLHGLDVPIPRVRSLGSRRKAAQPG